MKDNQMSRGASQALYRYLPDSWIDFSLRGKDRKNYVAHVVRWNSEQLVGINKNRLIRLVNQAVRSFESLGNPGAPFPPTSGFGNELTTENCDVLTPKTGGEERGVIAEISPLTFYCKECHKVYTFSSSLDYEKKSYCPKCHIQLSQLRQIYFHRCGFATDKHPVFCTKCKSSNNIYYFGKYEFVCGACKTRIDMSKKCDCGERLGPKVALDPSQYFPFSLAFIDLINEKDENLISNTTYGSYAIILKWINSITIDDFEAIKKDGIVSNQEDYNKIFEEFFKIFKNGMPEDMARISAEMAAKNKCGNKYDVLINDLKSKIFCSERNIKRMAEMLIEYDMVNSSKDVSTLEEAKIIAKKLNTNANPEMYDEIAKKFGITNAKVCGDVPFVSCSYGYTREKNEYKDEAPVQLRAFKEEKPGRKNVYANKLRTEGVIFEFDRKKIIRWLMDNNVLKIEDAPNLESDHEIKLWFLNNINLEEINTFKKIDKERFPYTSYVYNLIHSISHLLMKSASEICGLNKDSLSEYIFAGIPAVMIYCQNSQGFSLGALFNVFEAYFDKWLNSAKKHSDRCIYDPICIDRYKACTGCLFTNEISCQHFNHDLDRQLIIGHYDKKTKTRIKGFWEE